MQKRQKKQIVKIPKNIAVFYCKKKKLIILDGPLKRKSLKVELNLEINQKKQQIEIPSQLSLEQSNSDKKYIKALQGTTTSLIKQLLVETSVPIYQKLKLVGVGYRAFPVENFEKELLLFRLGFSHSIFLKIPKNIDIFCLKLTKLFINGNSYQNVTLNSAQIRSNKFPEPYKGKGILYENEKIILKEGKKV